MLARIASPIAAATTLVAAPLAARASNCAATPVGVDFESADCITVVDKTAAPTVHIAYSHPPEQLAMIQPGWEQSLHFYAFSARPSVLPLWLSQAQVDDATTLFMGSDCEVGVVPDEQILEKNQDLAGTWYALGDPLPVTADQATAGFDFDTSQLPDGTYLLYAYVDAGRFNAWFPFPGAFKIVSGPDPDAAPPSLYIVDLGFGTTYYPSQRYQVKVCTNAPAGSTLDLSWQTSVLPGEEPMEGLVAACYPASEPVINIPFVWPQSVAEAQVRFFGRIEDPMGRSHETFSAYRLVGPSTADCLDPNVPFKPTFCDMFTPAAPGDEAPDDRCGSGSTGGDTAGTGGTTASSAGNEDGGAAGCGCRTGRGPAAPARLLTILVLGGLVRRRTNRPAATRP